MNPNPALLACLLFATSAACKSPPAPEPKETPPTAAEADARPPEAEARPTLKITDENRYDSAAELGIMEGFPPERDQRVDRSNALMTPPYNRWSYLNMRTVYPTAGIDGVASPTEVPRKVDEEIAKLEVVRPEDGSVDMDTFLRETYTDALVVVKDGRIVHEVYLNAMGPDQPHQMMSVTKSFAGLFGLLAVEEGLLSESDKVSKFVPELGASGAFGEATFGQVLDMTNSMDFSEDYADPDSGIRQYSVVLGLMEPVAGRQYAESIYDYLVTLPKDPSHEHGEVFHYQTPKTDVVNWVTNRATGKSFQDNMQERLWSKIGAEGETYVLLDKNGTLFAGGGLNATPEDLARFAMMMLNGGKAGGEQVVPESVIEKLSKGGSRQAYAEGPQGDDSGEQNDSYRAQWWIRHTEGKEAIMAIGVHGQWIYLDLDRGVGIIKQSSQPTSADDYFDAYNMNAFDAIVGHLARK